MVSRDVLHELVDSLPEAEIATAERFLTIISKETIGLDRGTVQISNRMRYPL